MWLFRLPLMNDLQVNFTASASPPPPSPPPIPSIKDRLFQLEESYVNLVFQMDPLVAPMFGLDPFPDKLFRSSIKDLTGIDRAMMGINAAAKTMLKESNEEEEEEEGEGESDEVQKGLMFLEFATLSVLGSSYRRLIPAYHFEGPITDIAAMLEQYQTLETEVDLENYRKRLYKLKDAFEDMIYAFKSGIQHGVTLPRFSIERLIKACEGMVAHDAASSPFNMPLAKERAFALKNDVNFFEDAIETSVVPAYNMMREFLESDYMPHARSNAGLYGLPGYQEEYKNLIYAETSLRIEPDDLHQTGLKEVDRIWKRMIDVQKSIRPDLTMEEFRTALLDGGKTFPEIYLPEDKILQEYRHILQTIDNDMMPKFFSQFPEKFKSCVIQAVPKENQESAALASYMPGTPSKSGYFQVNMFLHKEKPIHQSIALTLHEANPGHHHQITLSMEDKDSRIIHKLVQPTSFVEGWGLYSEFLGEEMGLYDGDDFQLFGRLEMEMERALRLVIDTGLHWKGWTVEESVELMSQYLSSTLDEVVVEVMRYAVLPAQALAYKVGEMHIKELRQHAETQLGPGVFDVKEFHRVLLAAGSLPLEMLDVEIQKWIASVRRSVL